MNFLTLSIGLHRLLDCLFALLSVELVFGGLLYCPQFLLAFMVFEFKTALLWRLLQLVYVHVTLVPKESANEHMMQVIEASSGPTESKVVPISRSTAYFRNMRYAFLDASLRKRLSSLPTCSRYTGCPSWLR